MRITLATIAALGFFSSQVLAKKDTSDSLNIDWVNQHSGTHRGYPTDSVPKTDKISKNFVVEQFQVVKRHGTRYPGDDDIDAFNVLLGKLGNSTNKDLTSWTKKYDNQYKIARNGMLSSLGQEELYGAGQRALKSYPDIFKSVLDGDAVLFTAYSSWSERASQSGQAFLMGAFEGLGDLGSKKMLPVPMFSYPNKKDTMIAFHKACPRWVSEVDDGGYAASKIEPLDGLYVQPIATKLTKSLGFNVTIGDVKELYSACAFDVTMHNTADTFCKLLTKDDFSKLEYIDDLEHWFELSYGYKELSAGMACNLGKAIVSNIDAAAKGSNFPRLDLKFGHDETMLPLRTFFGLNKNKVPLAWNSTQDVIDSRQFRLSDFSYFGNSLAFQVLSVNNSTQKYVRVLDGEKAFVFPGCDNEYCPYEQFRAAVDPLLSCNYDKICAI
jgi:hypothetical protein